MFNMSALLLDDALNPGTPLTASAQHVLTARGLAKSMKNGKIRLLANPKSLYQSNISLKQVITDSTFADDPCAKFGANP